MPATAIVNGQTVVHKDSGGQVVTIDVCLTPCGPTMVPVPYCNIAKSVDTSDGSKMLEVDGHPIMLKDSKFAVSSGDSPGRAGVGSGTVKGWAKFMTYSNNTFVEGRPVCRRTDIMISNSGNTPPAPLIQPNNSARVARARGTHSLVMPFASRFPEIAGDSAFYRISASYEVTGPQTFRYEKKDGASSESVSKPDCAEGEYEMKIERDGERKNIPYEDISK